MPRVFLLRIVCCAALFMVSVGVSVLAQAPAFEAASIKRNSRSDTSFPLGGCHGTDTQDVINNLGAIVDLNFPGPPPLGRCIFNNNPLKNLIAIAYGVEAHKRDERILNGPDWILSSKYRIDAIAPNPASITEGDLKLMLQSLLVDRFKLKIHMETPALPGYALLVAKNGPKLGPATSDDPKKSGMPGRPGQIVSINMRISCLADGISGNLGQPVVDETGPYGTLLL